MFVTIFRLLQADKLNIHGYIMSDNQKQVAVGDLKPGMYVSRLDRPWLETPFKVQGGAIRNKKDIDRLMECCNYVYIDIRRSTSQGSSFVDPGTTLTDEEQKRLLIGKNPKHYEYKSTLKEELKSAYTEHAFLSNAITGMMEQTTLNNKLDLHRIQKAVLPMVESVLRNPDAFSWLTMMKRQNNYAYSHSLSAAIWSAVFGRNLGLPKDEIVSLSTGALLLDIGNVKLPAKLILNPKAYNSVEFTLVKKHVEYSLEIVSSIDGIKDEIIQMVATHHERHDGSGYPNSLSKNNIPLFGRVAGIIDCYDAIITERIHAPALSPHEAVKNLYGWSGKDFQAELVEQFLQVVGVYPVGTVAELSDGRVVVVVSHNKERRLRPRVMIVMNKDKQFYSKLKTINLCNETQGEDGKPLHITKTVNPSFYGIDTNQFFL